MNNTLTDLPLPHNSPNMPAHSGWRNLARYIIRRSAVSLLTVVAAVYIIIVVANYGGYVDEMIKSRIELTLGGMVRSGWLRDTPPEERSVIYEQTRAAMEEAEGLNKPFFLRTLNWLWDGLTLNWGMANYPRLYSSSNLADVRQIILSNVSRTLFMFGAAYLVLFVLAVFLALVLNRQYGRWFDKLFVLLSPLSSAPAWVYGVILSVLFLRVFTFSTGGTFDAWPEEFQLSYVFLLLRRLFLPFLAIVISGLFLTVNVWRTYFLIYSSEDYVEMAKARGLSNRQIERRYILRPALPGLLTSFALMTIVLWQEVILLEYIFNVAGVGRVFVLALQMTDTPVIVGLAVMFAYFLAFTVLFLDVVYAFVDPRVKVGEQEQRGSLAAKRRRGNGRIPIRFHLPRWRIVRPAPWSIRSLAAALAQQVRAAWGIIRQLKEYPTAVFGLIVIAFFGATAIVVVIAIPYEEAIADWRGDNNVWARNPKDAQPVWVNFFRHDKLPSTLTLDSRDPAADRQMTTISEGQTEITFTFAFDYSYNEFPQEMLVYFTTQFREKAPHVTMSWVNPAGQEMAIASMSVKNGEAFYFSRDRRLQRRLGSELPQQALFTNWEAAEEAAALPGLYLLQISALLFENDADLDAEFVLLGQVHGMAGTDSNRRDLSLALLWGTPIALAFGLTAAVATSFASMLLAAAGAWYGGWTDRLVQFFTEINLILPFLAVCLMVTTLYSRSIWAILSVTILLNIFNHSIKTYRAVFLQIKESPYMEAARAYGASDRRLVVHYLMPRVLPILLPKLIILVPSFVFLEATLAYLGVSDPLLPTWGKLVVDALSSGVYREAYHLVLAPFSLLFLVGFAFALVGLALERVFDPRLREI